MRRRSSTMAILGPPLLAVMTGACMVGPNYSRPAVEQPPAFKSVPPSSPLELPESGWWDLYADPELARLIAAANASNQTLRQAVARVDGARALARVAGSYLYPSVSANPAFSRTRYSGTRDSTTTGRPVTGGGTTVSDWIITADLSYEIDVWGRVRRSFESSRATARAVAADEGVVRLTVQADVARLYYTIRSLDAQDQILTQTVDAYREQVRILSVQLKNGLVGSIVVYQAQATLQTALAQQQDVQRARADVEHALAILCGRAAPSFSIPVSPLDGSAPPCVPVSLPAELLTRRPDVAEAEQNVVAANAQVGVATADFFPRFMLTGSAGFESASARDLFNWQSRVASILPSVSFPIFQGGRLKANLAATKAQYEQTVAAYVQQVFVAYGDVEDALTDLHALTDEVGSLREAVGASQNYLRLARAQYKHGLADYLLVIDAERTLLANRLLLAQTVDLQMGASVHLIKALGGGWERLD